MRWITKQRPRVHDVVKKFCRGTNIPSKRTHNATMDNGACATCSLVIDMLESAYEQRTYLPNGTIKALTLLAAIRRGLNSCTDCNGRTHLYAVIKIEWRRLSSNETQLTSSIRCVMRMHQHVLGLPTNADYSMCLKNNVTYLHLIGKQEQPRPRAHMWICFSWHHET